MVSSFVRVCDTSGLLGGPQNGRVCRGCFSVSKASQPGGVPGLMVLGSAGRAKVAKDWELPGWGSRGRGSVGKVVETMAERS